MAFSFINTVTCFAIEQYDIHVSIMELWVIAMNFSVRTNELSVTRAVSVSCGFTSSIIKLR